MQYASIPFRWSILISTRALQLCFVASLLLAMPRRQFGTHQIYIDTQEFFEGAKASLAENGNDPYVKLRFESLTSKQVAIIMQNGLPFVRRACVKGIKSYFALSRNEQRQVLYEAGVYQYIGPVETQTNSVHDAGRASPSDLESEIDWGSASEASSVDGVEPAPEHVAPWCELEVPDDGNRRRLRRKILAGHIPHDVKCVKPISCKQSRLSDEL